VNIRRVIGAAVSAGWRAHLAETSFCMYGGEIETPTSFNMQFF